MTHHQHDGENPEPDDAENPPGPNLEETDATTAQDMGLVGDPNVAEGDDEDDEEE